jgi:septal ring factor EnvC (AmiA/AmiB activator)
MYNQDAVNFCLNYYGKDKLIKDNKQDTVNFNNELQDEIKALQAEIATLKQTLEDTEAERKALLQQNGALILTLQQEKQEKMLLLPAPRKGIKETIRGWFQKEK